MLTPSQTFIYYNAKKDCIFNLFNISVISFISCLGFLFEDVNKMNLGFLIFKDNLLTFNHSLTLLNSVCIVMLSVFKQLLRQEIVVSSANSINDSNLLLFSMSFIYNRKRIGPRINPCVTPVFKVISFDRTSLYLTICFLLVK